MKKVLISLAAVLAALSVSAPARAALQTLEFSGYFLGGSTAPFPLSPATITGSLTYDPTNSGIVTPENYTFTNPDNTQGSSAWYRNAIDAFSFQSIGAAPGSSITGAYSSGGSTGAGTFVVFNNNSGLDALAPSTDAAQGLTGLAPAGYALVSAGLYYYDYGRILGSNALPVLGWGPSGLTPFSEFSGALFDATYVNLETGADTTIYATITLTAVPEASTWAMMLAGFAGLGMAGYVRSRSRAVTIAG